MLISRLIILAALIVTTANNSERVTAAPADRADGYHGIWYSNQSTGDEYKFKYSGGYATYPQQHMPIAIYSAAANKTFFVYGGARGETKKKGHQVVYFFYSDG